MTVAVQLAPGATSSQLFAWPYFAVVIEAWMKVTFAPVVLVKVTACVRAALPLKLRLGALRFTYPVAAEGGATGAVGGVADGAGAGAATGAVVVVLPLVPLAAPETAGPGDAAMPNFIAAAPDWCAPTSGASAPSLKLAIRTPLPKPGLLAASW